MDRTEQIEFFIVIFATIAEQTLKELGSFVKRLTDDKEKNIQEILTRKKEICEEIHKKRKSLNDHLNRVFHRDLRNDSLRFGQQLVILCSPLMTWLNDLLMILKIYDALDNRNTKNHHIRNTSSLL
jgi:hypothetical protein